MCIKILLIFYGITLSFGICPVAAQLQGSVNLKRIMKCELSLINCLHHHHLHLIPQVYKVLKYFGVLCVFNNMPYCFIRLLWLYFNIGVYSDIRFNRMP